MAEPFNVHGCPSCQCGRRVTVKVDTNADKGFAHPGTISWEEHLEIWQVFSVIYGPTPTAEEVAAAGGFGYFEIINLMGRSPKSWRFKRP